ncbi:MAG: NADH-quinone oxidoreductase subunit NuoE [Actinobacteria bacterium]|nr:MAG: NADH-quinone oxidoreductase subunit NuoE [Actinomycetota bacterium]
MTTKVIDNKQTKKILEKFEGKKGSLIPILQAVQEKYGYLPEDILRQVSTKTGIPTSQIFGVTTFYAQFRLQPRGKHTVRVCHGTACHVSGAEQLSEAIEFELGIKDKETTEDRLFTLESVACLGCCSLAPVMVVGEHTYGRCSPDKAAKILRKVRKEEGKE